MSDDVGFSPMVKARMEKGARDIWHDLFDNSRLVIQAVHVGTVGVRLEVTVQSPGGLVLWTVQDMPASLGSGETITIDGLHIGPRVKGFELV